jgi:hypothetical protein
MSDFGWTMLFLTALSLGALVLFGFMYWIDNRD